MIRTQIYLDDALRDSLRHRAKQRSIPMAQLIRDLLNEALSEEKDAANMSNQAILTLRNLKLKGGPSDLSENLDYYLYG
jgi:hypothetical protein